MKKERYYVFHYVEGELEQLSIVLDTLKVAKAYKEAMLLHKPNKIFLIFKEIE